MKTERPFVQRSSIAAGLISSVFLMAGCETFDQLGKPPAEKSTTTSFPVDSDVAKQSGSPYRELGDSRGKLLGDLKAEFPLPGFAGGSDGDDGDKVGTVEGSQPINAYLWRAALDTVAFLPIEVADVRGGVINTDWYEDPERPGERYKVNIFVISSELRSDGVRVGIVQEEQESAGGKWEPKTASREVANSLKTIIVGRALELSELDAS